MPVYVVPILQFAVLLALGALTRNRLLVLLGLLVGGAGTAMLADPSSLPSRPPEELALLFGGLVIGTAAGLWSAGAQERQARAERIAREVATGRPQPKRPAGPGERAATWVAAALLLALGAGLGLYLEGETVPEVRAMVDGWRTSPAAQSMGLPAPSAPSPEKRAASGTPKGATASGGERPQARAAAPVERPRGDMRHCLERGGTQDVLRCAEQGR